MNPNSYILLCNNENTFWIVFVKLLECGINILETLKCISVFQEYIYIYIYIHIMFDIQKCLLYVIS